MDDEAPLIEMESRSGPLLSTRIRAVRPEVINFLSFLSVVSTFWMEEVSSIVKFLFLTTGLLILTIDAYFIHCQWSLQKSHAIPFLSKTSGSRSSTNALDDLLSDLPQSLWMLLYLFGFNFSLIAMVCALQSRFSVVEDVWRLRE